MIGPPSSGPQRRPLGGRAVGVATLAGLFLGSDTHAAGRSAVGITFIDCASARAEGAFHWCVLEVAYTPVWWKMLRTRSQRASGPLRGPYLVSRTGMLRLQEMATPTPLGGRPPILLP